MKRNFVLATIIMVVSIAFTTAAQAGEYEKCLARCAMMDLSSQPPCERNCQLLLSKPLATATPVTTTTATATGKKPPKPAPTTQPQPEPPPSKECTADHEAPDKACVCELDFERYPAETGPCVAMCAQGSVRNVQGECEKCGPTAEFDCGACVEKFKAELASIKADNDRKLETLSAQADRNFYMLLGALLLLLALLGWKAKDQTKKSTTKK